jgi:type II restriction enzyme
MAQIGPREIVQAINNLPKNKDYKYINDTTKGMIRIHQVKLPEGPIEIKRFDPSKGETAERAKVESISTSMILRVANGIRIEEPFNLDIILGASYNTRSVLESLLAHTPDYFVIYPGRIEYTDTTQKMKKGHKHLVYKPFQQYKPYNPHENGILGDKVDSNLTMAVLPSRVFVYDDGLSDAEVIQKIKERKTTNANQLDKDVTLERIHAQMQVALFEIGKKFQCKSFIAKNDQSLKYQGIKLSEHSSIVTSICDVQLFKAFPEAEDKGKLIDCIWFKGEKEMPAVFEIENSTGVTSGLVRMKKFKDAIPPFTTKYIIVAPDDDISKVKMKANEQQFKELNIWYFSYSAVMELYALCKGWDIRGITDEFLESFMEKVIAD